MADHFWVVRNPDGHAIGVSVRNGAEALSDAEACLPPNIRRALLMDTANDPSDSRYGHNNFTLTRETLPARVAASEPVAWAIFDAGGEYFYSWSDRRHAEDSKLEGDTVVPLYAAPPSAAAVRVTDAMVEAAARALRDGFRSVHANNEGNNVWRGLASISIHAALTAASEVQP